MTLEMTRLFYTGDYVGVSTFAGLLTPESIDSDQYRQTYDYIMVQNYQVMYETCLNNGIAAYQGQNPNAGITLLDAALRFNPDSTPALLYIGVCYHSLGDKATADTYYNRIINEFPDSPEAPQALHQRDG